MSVVFFLKNSKLSVETWQQLLARWAQAQDEQPYDEPQLEGTGSGDEQMAHLWRPGSVRGVLVFLRRGAREAEVHLKALASRRDWLIGFTILRAALQHGGGVVVRETGQRYPIEDLTKERAIADAVEEFCVSAQAVAAKAESLFWIPSGIFSLPLTADRLRSCTRGTMPAIESDLARTIRTYASAFRATTMVHTNGTRSAAWPFIPMLVGKVDRILYPAEGPSEEISYGQQLVSMPLARLLGVLGDRAQDLKETVFLPELEAERDAAIVQALLEGAEPSGGKESNEPRNLPAGGSPRRGAVESAPGRRQDAGGDEAPGDRGDDEPKERLEADEGDLEVVAKLLFMIASLAVSGQEPPAIRKELRKLGVPRELAEDLITLAGMTVQGLLVEEKAPAAVLRDMVANGVPEPMARRAVRAVASALKGRGK